MKRLTLIITAFILIVGSLSLYSATGTPSNLVVRTDANNYLLVTAATQTNPVTQGVFASRTLRTDANGSLQVVLTGSVTPTYPMSIPASTCAAPSLGMSGGTTTGIAFTATPSILNCISGTARTTLTASSFTLTVPILEADGTAGTPSYSFANSTNKGFYSTGTNALGVSFNGSAVQYWDATQFALGSGVAIEWTSNADPNLGTVDVSLSRGASAFLRQGVNTTANRFDVSNTFTSATNYESFSVDWQTASGTAYVGNRTAATGTGRPLRLLSQASNAANSYAVLNIRGVDSGPPYFLAGLLTTADANISSNQTGNWFEIRGGTSTATSGQVNILAITPTYNQTSGNAANTDLLINRTQTAVGSGTQRLIDAQVGGVSQYFVSNVGVNAANAFQVLATGHLNWATVLGGSSRYRLNNSSDGLLNLESVSGATQGIQFNSGTAAPTVGTCGTGTITANSRNTTGGFTATGATACTVTFGAPAWTNTPFCTISLRNAPTTTPYISAKSTTAITVSGLTAGDIIDYTCIGPI